MNYTVWENYLSMIIITTKQNKQHGSKSTNYNLQMWPFEPAGKKPMFPERSVRVSTEGENENIRHIFDLRVHVFAKCGNGRKEIAGRWQNNSLCQSYVSRALLKCKVSYRKILSGETLCFLEKRLLSLFKFCTMSKLLFSYELLIGPLPTFLECILLFTCDLIGQRWPWSQYLHCSFDADVCVIKSTVHKQLTQQVTLSMLIIETFSSLTRSMEKDFFTKNHETWTSNQMAANAQKHATSP